MIPERNPAPGFEHHPEHKVHSCLFAGEVICLFEGAEIARTKNAVMVEETNHSPAYYFPEKDVDNSYLRDSQHVTRCPFKGKARYWNLRVGNHEIDNAVWAYEMPYDEALELAGMMAFFPHKVEIKVIPA